MSLAYLIPDATVSPRALEAAEKLLGRDLFFRGDFEVAPNGDYLAIDGVAAARQSVEREGLASPGDLPTSPDWGFGIAAELKKPDTKSIRDLISNRAKARLAANPRIESVGAVQVFRDANTDALITTVHAVAAGRKSTGIITDSFAAVITTGGQRQ